MKRIVLIAFIAIISALVVNQSSDSRMEYANVIPYHPIVAPSTTFDCPNGDITVVMGTIEISLAPSDVREIEKKFGIDSVVWVFEASEDAGCVSYFYIDDPCPRHGRIELQTHLELLHDSNPSVIWNSDLGPPDCDFAGFYMIKAVIYSRGDFHYSESAEVLVVTTVTKPAAEIEIIERVCKKSTPPPSIKKTRTGRLGGLGDGG
ncbi:MAG: hypothetical protein G01um101420_711 [Parcubacteria group bacterium Gr01-1014_20]|nr:MAG: hypothetical protein G01um101420_711 [Parcubacteria group bacterium Gr01-1014_20]